MMRWLFLSAVMAVTVEASEQPTINNLRQIGLAIAQWSSDNSDNLPDMKSLKNFKAVLMQFVGNEKVFLDALTGEPLRLNGAMAGHHWQEESEQILVFTRAREDGSRLALFNDGQVQGVPKGRWEELRRNKQVNETDDVVEQKLQNLETLGKALTEYVQDGDKTLPPLNDLAATKAAMLPYTQMQDVFVLPGTKTVYAVNGALARKKLAEIKSPELVVVFYEAAPLTNDTRGVLYLNGKVERIPEAMWPELKERSGIR
ncbi:MAG: hypothetical protein WCS70_05140 [Verrucomicrobiota bacterium]